MESWAEAEPLSEHLFLRMFKMYNLKKSMEFIMKKATSMFTGFALIAILFIAGPGFAGMNGGKHKGFGKMAGCQCRIANLTEAQQAEAKTIEAKYADQLTKNENAIKAKAGEMKQLLANDQTTVAQLKQMRVEMFLLKQDYRKLRISINQEITKKLGVVYCNCGNGNCQGPGQCRMMNGNRNSSNMKMGNCGANCNMNR